MSIINNLSQLGRFWQESLNQKVFRYIFLIVTFQILFLVLKFNSLPPQVPMFYTLPWGEKQLTSATSLFLLPGLTIFIVLIDYLIAASISSKNTLFSRLLVIISLIFSCITLISLVQIIRLVS